MSYNHNRRYHFDLSQKTQNPVNQSKMEGKTCTVCVGTCGMKAVKTCASKSYLVLV